MRKMKLRCEHGLPRARERRLGLVVAACVLLMGPTGCGSSSSDSAPGLSSRPTVTNGTGAVAPRTAEATRTGERSGGDRSSQGDRTADQPVAAEQAGARNPLPAPTIPDTVAKDLASPDARDRYHALDYWEAKDSKAPLDPVFEAMEDDDPAVRAKATAIAEQYWAAEQEREKG